MQRNCYDKNDKLIFFVIALFSFLAVSLSSVEPFIAPMFALNFYLFFDLVKRGFYDRVFIIVIFLFYFEADKSLPFGTMILFYIVSYFLYKELVKLVRSIEFFSFLFVYYLYFGYFFFIAMIEVLFMKSYFEWSIYLLFYPIVELTLLYLIEKKKEFICKV